MHVWESYVLVMILAITCELGYYCFGASDIRAYCGVNVGKYRN